MLRISPQIQGVQTLRPTHLSGFLQLLERTEREPLRIIVNMPPRHSKTETLLHFIARRLRRRPWDRVVYTTYDANLATRKSVSCREYYQRAGGELRGDAASVQTWLTPQLGGAIWTSIGGGVTGEGCNVLVVDDPHKDRAEAESALSRERVWEWYVGTAIDRVEVGGSIIVCQTRWHPDDLSGRLQAERPQDGWIVVSLPALGWWNEDGTREAAQGDHNELGANERAEALWPERWSKEELLKKFAGDYEWLSKYQQKPTKRGGSVFREPAYYRPDEFAFDGAQVSIGIDCAYNEETHNDHSVVVVLARIGSKAYVLYAQAEHCELPAFAEIVRGVAALYPGAKIRWHTSTTEKGTAQLMKVLGLPVKHELAKADKFTRALPVSAAWNMGAVLVPCGYTTEAGVTVPAPAWVAPFVKHVQAFTGIGDRRDDDVDALTSAYSAWVKAGGDRIDTGYEEYGYG